MSILERNTHGILDRGDGILAVHTGYERRGHVRGAHGFACVVVRTVAETFLVHLLDHREDTAVFLGLALRQRTKVNNLCAHEEHRRAVRARGGAGSAADTRGGIHRGVCVGFRNGNSIAIGCRTSTLADKATRLDDAVVGFAIDREVAQHGEGRRTEGLDRDRLAVLELAHVDVTRGATSRTVRHTIDGEATRATNAFAAVIVELERLDTLFDKLLAHYVEHFEERRIGRNILRLVGLKFSRIVCVFLTPDFQRKIHANNRVAGFWENVKAGSGYPNLKKILPHGKGISCRLKLEK